MKTQEPIKMMFLLDDFQGPKGGGTEVQFINLIESLDRDLIDFEIDVFRPSKYTDNHYSYPFTLNVLHIYKMFSLKTLCAMMKFALRIRREKIKIVQIFFNDAAIIAPLFCKLGGAKVITSRRDMGFWYTKLNLFCLRISNFFVDQIIANSDAVKSNVSSKEKCPANKISVIYNGIDDKKFTDITKGNIRAELGIDTGDIVIGVVANLDKIKRHADLLHAFAKVGKQYSHLKLVFAGQGPEEGNLKELVQTLNLADKVFFLGSVAQVLPVIADMDIGVLCSESEGLSNAIIEYMGCSKPVICTNTGGNPELIKDGYNGYLVDVYDVDAIAEKLQLLISDKELSVTLGNNGASRFKDTFGMDTMVESHMRLYRNVLEINQ